MGELRFTIGGLREILSQGMYPLRVAIWPGHVPAPEQGSGSTVRSHQDEPSMVLSPVH